MSDTGTIFPGTGADDAAVGTVSWSSTGNITADDAAVAQSSPAGPATTHYLKATNFGFAIPGGATIDGIKLEIKKRQNFGTPGIVTDSAVYVVKADATLGSTNKAEVPAWGAALAYSTYGGSADLWSESWTAADINDADFGFVISASVSNNCSIEVDAFRVTIYYTGAGGQVSDNASFLLNFLR